MILKLLNDYHNSEISERFNREADLVRHYTKHAHDPFAKQFTKMFPTAKAYETAAEELARTPIDNKTIFGYVTNKDGVLRNVKYNKDTQLMTIYVVENGEIITITAFLRDFRRFFGERYRFYYDEIIE